MSLPVRCFSCNNVIGHLETAFMKVEEKDIPNFLDENNIVKCCCRRMFLGYVPWRKWVTGMPFEIQTGDKKQEPKEN